MIRVNSLMLSAEHNEADLRAAVIKRLHIPDRELLSLQIVKKSLDARKKSNIHYVYAVDVQIRNEQQLLKNKHIKDICPAKTIKYSDPVSGLDSINLDRIRASSRPVIIGFGPAGMFAAYKLAAAGLRPIVLERGMDVEARTEAVRRFWQNNSLDPECNVQFGEGGAGTFSDGKLNTMIHDSFGRIGEVFDIFIRNGADESIRYNNKPHIGSDRLTKIVKSMREFIISQGGEVRFNSRMDDIIIENNRITGVTVNKRERIDCSILILAVGHSARDTLTMLTTHNIPLERKDFAMGVRVQHPQDLINRSQYGDESSNLPAADYKLTYTTTEGRAVYSFCMCPGGFVVNASSEPERLTVNGMSNSDRSEATANSAIVVNIKSTDFEGDNVLAGMEFQRRLEGLCYREGHGLIPVQYYRDFKNHEPSSINDASTNAPNTKGKYYPGNLHNVLPAFISDSILEAMPHFGSAIAGFDDDYTLMLGLEARTSSPVRILRNDSLESILAEGLYPCGEGAGYAGGITSAAVDGIKVYEAVITKLLHGGNYV